MIHDTYYEYEVDYEAWKENTKDMIALWEEQLEEYPDSDELKENLEYARKLYSFVKKVSE